jgi:transcriptional regulator with XRE-family HTH domain
MGNATCAVNAHIGKRITERRTELGVSRATLGNAIGVSYQQIQKYEAGIDRVSAERLFRIAGMLRTPVCYFFDPITADPLVPSELSSRERASLLRLIRAFVRTQDRKRRRAMIDMVEMVAQPK